MPRNISTARGPRVEGNMYPWLPTNMRFVGQRQLILNCALRLYLTSFLERRWLRSALFVFQFKAVSKSTANQKI